MNVCTYVDMLFLILTLHENALLQIKCIRRHIQIPLPSKKKKKKETCIDN